MMTTKFIGIYVLTSSDGRRLAKPPTPLQIDYLNLLDVSPDVFTKPPPRAGRKKTMSKKTTQNSS
jgi:hypothetical protein